MHTPQSPNPPPSLPPPRTPAPQEAEAEEEAAATGGADADKDVRPSHVGGGAGRGGGGGGEGEEEDDDDEPERRWNLRKCSAMGLDHLSNVFNDEILPLLMPVVEARLADADWRKRESAILALGAVRWAPRAFGLRERGGVARRMSMIGLANAA